jgi:hypothetical protein
VVSALGIEPGLTENILITSLRRSGGTLVGRLLDGHPECSVFPFEHVYTAKKLEFSWKSNLLFPLLSPERKLKACGFGKSFAQKVAAAHPDASDTAAFHDELLALAGRARSVAAFYQPSSDLYFRHFHGEGLRAKLVNHVPNLCTLGESALRRTFGRHRAVLSIRDPRAVFASLRNKRNKDYPESVIPDFCRDWRESVERHHLGDSEVVSFLFEDLVHHPEVVMPSLAEQLGIAFDEILLQPTKVGLPIGANSSFTRSAGIDPSAADSWKTELDRRPRREIEERLGPLMQRLGYL